MQNQHLAFLCLSNASYSHMFSWQTCHFVYILCLVEPGNCTCQSCCSAKQLPACLVAAAKTSHGIHSLLFYTQQLHPHPMLQRFVLQGPQAVLEMYPWLQATTLQGI